MTTAAEIRERVVNKAAADGAFRARLIADPKAAIADEFEVILPDGFDVVVHEETAYTGHLVLPASPQLSEAELETVAGAANWGPFQVMG